MSHIMSSETQIKLIAMDLDGTLLNSKKQVPPDFFEMLPKLRAKGIHVVIASGRQYYNILKLFESVKDDLVFMADNGALLNVYGKTYIQRHFEREDVERILAEAAKIPTAHSILCLADAGYTGDCSENVSKDVALYYERVVPGKEAFERARHGEVLKIAVHDDENSAKNLFPTMKYLDGDKINIRVSGDVWLDAMPFGVDKGDGIRDLQKILGVLPEESMAFGDFDNDLGLLSQCDESYAMANGTEALKNVAKYQAPSNDENGVMVVLHRYFD